MFSQVCVKNSADRGGGLPLGRLYPGGGLLGEGFCPGGYAIQGGWADSPPPKKIGYYGIRSTSGRYASYWNAFLLQLT